MGIGGLLKLVDKAIKKNTSIKYFKGKKVAVDAYAWLHQGSYGCATDLVLGTPTDKYVDYIIKKVKMMRHFGVEPYLVFDGARLPAKSGEEKDRKDRRSQLKQKGMDLLAKGMRADAEQCFRQSVDINPEMAKRVIDELERLSPPVEYVVAPYEADAQMAWLARTGKVQGVVTEDSDMIAYGCPFIFFKLDHQGNGDLICIDDLAKVDDFKGWTHEMIRWMAILAGCDYCPKIPNIGMKKAVKIVHMFKDKGKILRALKQDPSIAQALPRDYDSHFYQADNTFQHQTIFNTDTNQCEHLESIPDCYLTEDPSLIDYLGPLDVENAERKARGEIDPISNEEINLNRIKNSSKPKNSSFSAAPRLRQTDDPFADPRQVSLNRFIDVSKEAKQPFKNPLKKTEEKKELENAANEQDEQEKPFIIKRSRFFASKVDTLALPQQVVSSDSRDRIQLSRSLPDLPSSRIRPEEEKEEEEHFIIQSRVTKNSKTRESISTVSRNQTHSAQVEVGHNFRSKLTTSKRLSLSSSVPSAALSASSSLAINALSSFALKGTEACGEDDSIDEVTYKEGASFRETLLRRRKRKKTSMDSSKSDFTKFLASNRRVEKFDGTQGDEEEEVNDETETENVDRALKTVASSPSSATILLESP